MQIETLPTRNANVEPLKNVLSICSAGQNRYLLHFSSFHSLVQWTAAIRLTMFEHTSLHEAYTGSILAGKGKHLNNIRAILERSRFRHEDWARVRFGAGTPWKRCWFVISPPNEKDVQKTQKTMKKRSAYDRAPRVPMGDIKFYDTKKVTKKTSPIATIHSAHAAYAIWPESKALIEQSTLVKIEGRITLHSVPGSTSEGFVFVMPEIHPAVSGFELMLRFLVPTFDVFGLYGRPTRLIADTMSTKSIMFAFPKDQRYGYLDMLDVANLMQAPGSPNWTEEEWRKRLKEATAERMSAANSEADTGIVNKPRFRSSLPNRHGNVRMGHFRNQSSDIRPDMRPEFNQSAESVIPDSQRNGHDLPYRTRNRAYTAGPPASQRLAEQYTTDSSPEPPTHGIMHEEEPVVANGINERSSSESDRMLPEHPEAEEIEERLQEPAPPTPVAMPPAFTHRPSETPPFRPEPSHDLRKASNRMSSATLSELAAAGGASPSYDDHRPSSSPAQRMAANDWGYAGTHEQSHEASEPPAWAPPVPEHRTSMMGSPEPPSSRPTSRDLQMASAKAVKRKPIPQPPQVRPPDSPRSVGEPSYDDLRHTVDEEALNQVGPHRQGMRPSSRGQDDGSVYDDASTVSPDYASTHESVYSRKSPPSTPKARMGVKRTVGASSPTKDVMIGDSRFTLQERQQKREDIPAVNFGPTLSYDPTTGGPTPPESGRSSRYRGREPTEPPRYYNDRPYSKSPSRDDYRRSMPWQPGMAAPHSGSSDRLTPEQYVQQRANTHQRYVHRRPVSSSPQPRPQPGDGMPHSQSHPQFPTSHSPGRELPPRPHSRGPSMLNYNELSPRLTAREQEHVARMTGSPLLDLSGGNHRQSTPVNPMGLVGAIDTREREKQDMRDGVSNQMVQHAIAQRSQHLQPPDYFNHNVHPGTSHNSVYNMPAASHTWDHFQQNNRGDDPRRQSWYGQLGQRHTPSPPGYQQSQFGGPYQHAQQQPGNSGMY